MFKLGDLVRYVPYNAETPGSWIMYGGIGIIVAILPDMQSSVQIYKVKWLENMEESLLPSDFLKILEF